MYARLIAERAVGVLAPDDENGLFQTVQSALAGGEHFDLPAFRLGVAGVHAIEVGGEQAGLVAASSGADLDDRRPIIQRVPRRQEIPEISLERRDATLELFHLGVRQLA